MADGVESFEYRLNSFFGNEMSEQHDDPEPERNLPLLLQIGLGEIPKPLGFAADDFPELLAGKVAIGPVPELLDQCAQISQPFFGFQRSVGDQERPQERLFMEFIVRVIKPAAPLLRE